MYTPKGKHCIFETSYNLIKYNTIQFLIFYLIPIQDSFKF